MTKNYDFTNFGDRILYAIEFSGKSQRQIAIAIGITPQALNKWPRTGNASKEALSAFSKETGVSLDWLMKGDGPAERVLDFTLKTKNQKINSQARAVPGKPKTYTVNDFAKKYNVERDPDLFGEVVAAENSVDHYFAKIPKYDISFSAGHGANIEDESENGFLYFRKDWIAKKGLDESNLCVVYVKGDSMEPTINHGEVILIDRSEYYTHPENIDDGFIYAINIDRESMVKRLFRKPGGRIIVRSDSPAPQYEDMLLEQADMEYFKIIGRAIWHAGDL